MLFPDIVLEIDRIVRSRLFSRVGLPLCIDGDRTVRDRLCESGGLDYVGRRLLVEWFPVGVSHSRSNLVHWRRSFRTTEVGHYVREESRAIGIFVDGSRLVSAGKVSRQVWRWLWESQRSMVAICTVEEVVVSDSALRRMCMKVSLCDA